MKHKFFLASLMLLFCTFLSAETYNGTCGAEGDNLTWTLDTETGILTISGTGAMADYDSYVSDNTMQAPWHEYRSYIKKVEIAEGVTYIGNYAFYYCQDLSSVTIPGSVTSIGYLPFEDCTNLTSIKVDDNNTAYCDMDGVLFDKTITTLIQYPVGKTDHSYYILESVTSIGDNAFDGCSSLTSVTIPNSVTTIGWSAFYNCSGLTSVTIPSSVTSIGRNAFADCSGLTSIIVESENTQYDSRKNCNAIIETETNTLIVGCQNTIIPNSVTSIGDWAFADCMGLTSIAIPNSVKSIGDFAFYGCSGLTSVTIPNNVTSIGSDAFYGVPNIMYNGSASGSPWGAKCVNGYVDGWFVYKNDLKTDLVACSSAATGKIEIPNTVKSIGERAFQYCYNLTSVTIPNSVTSIGGWAFSGCDGLEEVHISDIEKWCAIEFYSSTSNPLFYSKKLYVGDNLVNDLVIPTGVTSIKKYAFINCSGLTSIEIPNSVISIDTLAFYACSALNSIEIPNSVKNIGYAAFYNCRGLMSVTLGNNISNIGESAFQNCSGLTSVTISESVQTIGAYPFYGCSNLTSVTWNAINCTTYDDGQYVYPPFQGCENITTFIIWENVESLPRGLCYGQPITSIVIPDKVTSIGIAAFRECNSLTSITIPASVTSIGNAAFYGCTGLTAITAEAGTPAVCQEYTFYEVDKSIPLYVPNGRVEAYKAAYGWKDFYNIQAISSTPSAIEETQQSASSSINANGDTRKVIENGQLYILLPDGRHYNLQGMEVK